MVLATMAACALVAGVAAVFTEVQAAPCRCPLLYAPVQCDNGKIFSNQCFADCRNAKNCVPIGAI
jgi:hypothetical protein